MKQKMKKVLIIDNYDSFTYNLVHLVEEILGYEITIWRNDEIDYDQISDYEYIILSPGPGIPSEAGDLLKVIREYSDKVKMLGVCLGHQAIAEAYGATLINLDTVYHGVQTQMELTDAESVLFQGIESPFAVGRYHSWVMDRETVPVDFVVTSRDDDGEVMSMRHRSLPIYSVQFHPESILTPKGKVMMQNFLNL